MANKKKANRHMKTATFEVCVCIAVYPLALSGRRSSSVCESDPGYRAAIVRRGMGCMLGSE